ncbi:hypothetical protein CXB77_14410 [Chromatium okenii]|uniref:Uncharacterized protein n=1 Tax=Chromatium okenii TaxID=61644 RepID=A0A2S7XP08_9GAMM|nr:hypothetical protein CXB77_14410 [Chromatium okenii]
MIAGDCCAIQRKAAGRWQAGDGDGLQGVAGIGVAKSKVGKRQDRGDIGAGGKRLVAGSRGVIV